MFAIPKTLRIRIRILTAIAKAMFACMIPMVLRAMVTVLEIFLTSSSINTTSAASIAASDPISPMAIPTSERIRTGASFTPSPTNARDSRPFCSVISFSTISTLPPGSSCAYTRSTPACPAIARAADSLSPVSITVCATPAAFRSRIASGTPSFIVSEITIVPANVPSHATYTTVPPCSSSENEIPYLRISFAFPARIW